MIGLNSVPVTVAEGWFSVYINRMQIIIVPEGIRNGIPACLTTRHIILILLVGVILLPAVVGTLTYKLLEIHDRQNGGPIFSAYRQELVQSRAALRKAREDATRSPRPTQFTRPIASSARQAAGLIEAT